MPDLGQNHLPHVTSTDGTSSQPFHPRNGRSTGNFFTHGISGVGGLSRSKSSNGFSLNLGLSRPPRPADDSGQMSNVLVDEPKERNAPDVSLSNQGAQMSVDSHKSSTQEQATGIPFSGQQVTHQSSKLVPPVAQSDTLGLSQTHQAMVLRRGTLQTTPVNQSSEDALSIPVTGAIEGENDLAVIMMNIAEQMHRKNEDRQKEVQRQAEELDQARETIQQQGQVIHKLNESCRMVIQAVTGQRDKVEANRQRIDKMKQSCKLYSITIKRLDKMIKDADAEKSKLLQMLTNVQKDCQDLATERDKVTSEKRNGEQLAHDLQSTLRKQLDSAVAQNETITAQYQSASKRAESLESDIVELQAKHRDAIDRLKRDAADEISTLKSEKDSLRNELSSSRSALKNLTEASDTAEQNAKARIAALEVELKSLESRQHDLEDAKKRLTREVEDLTEKLEKSTKESRDAEARHTQLTAELEENRCLFQRKETQWQEVKSRLISQIEEGRDRLRSAELDWKAKCQELESERDRLHREATALKTMRDDVLAKSEDVSAVFNKLGESQRKEIELLSERNRALQASLNKEQNDRAQETEAHRNALDAARRSADGKQQMLKLEYEKRYDGLAEELREVQYQLATQKKSHDRMVEDHNEEMLRWRQRHDKTLAEYNQEQAKWETKLSLLQDNLQKVQSDLVAATKRAEVAEKIVEDLSDLQPNHTALVKRARELEATLAEACAARDEAVGRVQYAERNLGEAKQERTAQQEQAEKMERELKGTVRKLEQDVDELKRGMVTMEAERDHWKAETAKCRTEKDSEIEKHVGSLQELSKLFDIRESEKAGLSAMVDKLRREKAELQQSLAAWEEAKGQSQKDSSATAKAHKAFTQKIQGLENSVKQLTDENTALKGQLEDYAVDRDISSQQIQALKEDLNSKTELADDVAHLQNRCDQLELESEELRKGKEAAETRVDSLLKERDQLLRQRETPSTPRKASTVAEDRISTSVGALPQTPVSARKEQLPLSRGRLDETCSPTANSRSPRKSAVTPRTPRRPTAERMGNASECVDLDARSPSPHPRAGNIFSQIESMQEEDWNAIGDLENSLELDEIVAAVTRTSPKPESPRQRPVKKGREPHKRKAEKTGKGRSQADQFTDDAERPQKKQRKADTHDRRSRAAPAAPPTPSGRMLRSRSVISYADDPIEDDDEDDFIDNVTVKKTKPRSVTRAQAQGKRDKRVQRRGTPKEMSNFSPGHQMPNPGDSITTMTTIETKRSTVVYGTAKKAARQQTSRRMLAMDEESDAHHEGGDALFEWPPRQ
ncbi:hypothetical protein HK104_010803 [Borealophlyctis nickersoniae]|nr:hypothetical protein HK104_010803 [Borealophlyctis nickersoniae]